MKFTKLELIAVKGIIAGGIAVGIGKSLKSEDTIFYGAISMAACASYIGFSQIRGYCKDLRQMESESQKLDKEYKNKN